MTQSETAIAPAMLSAESIRPYLVIFRKLSSMNFTAGL
jgi:hypothetical protein